MRVSTAQQQAMILQDIQNLNQSLIRGLNQVATGQQIPQPANAPGNWTQLQGVRREIHALDQYINSIDELTAQLNQEDVMLFSYISYLQDIRSLILEANNGALEVVDLSSMGEQIYQWRGAIIGLLNSRDAEGYYLFAGSQTGTPPVTVTTADSGSGGTTAGGSGATITGATGTGSASASSASNSTASASTTAAGAGTETGGAGTETGGTSTPGPETGPEDSGETFTFNNNNDVRQITVASDITMSSTDNAETLCFTINDNGSGFNLITVLGQLQQTLQTPPDDIATALTGYLLQIDQAQSQVGNIQADLGTRLKALQGIRADHQQTRLFFQELAGQLGDLDYASALSQLSLQKVQMEAALKGLAEVDGLSLFNYL